MATLSIQTSLNDTGDNERTFDTVAITTAGDGKDQRRPAIGTSEETHTIDTDIGNAGYCYIKNRDSTNYLELGFSTGVYSMKLLAGHVALFPLIPTASALFLKANTAEVDVDILIREV